MTPFIFLLQAARTGIVPAYVKIYKYFYDDVQ